LSLHCITENGGEVLFTKRKVQIFKDKNVVMEGKKEENGLFVIHFNTENHAMTTQKKISKKVARNKERRKETSKDNKERNTTKINRLWAQCLLNNKQN
jgi:hypothetical protein